MKASLNQRVVSLEKQAGLANGLHVIIPADGESQHDATKRYCLENGLRYEQLKTVVHLSHEDVGLL
jgi:hypothetical protein